MTVIAMDVVNSETNVEIVRMSVISASQVSSRASASGSSFSSAMMLTARGRNAASWVSANPVNNRLSSAWDSDPPPRFVDILGRAAWDLQGAQNKVEQTDAATLGKLPESGASAES